MSHVIPREHRVSHSEVDYFVQCPRKHYYAYIKNIRRRSSSIALHRGNVGHELVEKFFHALMAGEINVEDRKDYLTNTANQMFVEGKTDAESFSILRKQIDAFAFAYPFADWKILGVEKRLVTKVSDTLYFPFIVDLILRDPDNNIVVVDHKFTKDFYKPWNLDINPQIPKYIAALREEGKPADIGCYSIFRTGFGQNAGPESIYKLQPIETSEKRIKNTWREQYDVSRMIQDIKVIYRDDPEYVDRTSYRIANNMVCNSCPFQRICVADLNGWATGPLLKTEYEVKTEEEFVYDES